MKHAGKETNDQSVSQPKEDNSRFSDRFIQRYAELFVHEFDRHGLQRSRNDKVWYRNNIPGGIGYREIYSTLNGQRTYAGYPVDHEGLSKWTMFDLDLPKPIRTEMELVTDPVFKARQEEYAWSVIYEMGRLLKNAIQQNFDVAPVTLHSGSKGLHLYVLWNKPVPVRQAADVGLLMKHLLDVEYRDQGFEFRDVESYPCESDVGAIESDRLPHLVKLPLATHLKTGKIARFMNLRTKEELPAEVLWNIKRARADDIDILLDTYKEELVQAKRRSGRTSTSTNNYHPDHERFNRLSLPNGPKLLLERCEALGNLAAEARSKHHLGHRQRFHLASSLLAFGSGEGEKAVHDIISSCSDYSFDYTQGQLNHSLLRDYRPPTCLTLQKDGICPYKDSRCSAVGNYRTPLGCVQPTGRGKPPVKRQRLRVVQQDQEESVKPTSTIEQIRKEIPEQIDRYLAEPEGRLLLFKVDPGVGKTVSVGHHLANLGLSNNLFRVFWAGQRHDMFHEIFPLFFDIRQILPKLSDKEDPLTQEPLQRCINPELQPLLKIIRDKGWWKLETRKVCSRCEFKKEHRCPYFNQWLYNGSYYGPQQHLVTDRLQENNQNIQAILIDESPFHVFQNEIPITVEMVEAMILYVTKHDFRRKEWVTRLLKALIVCMVTSSKSTHGHEFLQHFNDALRGELGKSHQEQLFYEREEITSQDPPLHSLVQEINQSHFWIDWDQQLEIASPKELPQRWLDVLFEAINKEKMLFGTDYTSRLYLRVEKQEKHQLKTTLVVSETRTFTDKSTPLIILDGTPNLPEYERIFDREVILYEGHVHLQNRVVQVKTGEYTKSTLLGGGGRNTATRDRLLAIVQAIIQRGTSTLVVSIKEMVEEHLEPYLEQHGPPGSYHLAYYWGFRGSNEFKHCDQVVLLGAANPNFDELRHQESGSHLHESFLDPEMESIWLPYEDQDLEVNVSGYVDDRMNNALLFRRNHEMGQMIHRIRPLHDPDKTIWILSCVPVPGIPPTQLMTVEELAGHLGLINEAPRNKGALGHLVQVANQLLEDQGWFNRKTLSDTSKVAIRTVAKHIGQVQQIMGLMRSGQRYLRPKSVHDPLI